jgi:ribulose-5-phosphate 4-epimerase/fuculose-1-phosphate aldolase
VSIDEGYIKYVSHWTEGALPHAECVAELERWRAQLYDAGLIGHYDHLDVGFGNLSIRAGNPGQFIVSGTQTGHLAHTTADHYALVTKADVAGNAVWSVGPSRASSEALTHAAIYRLSDAVGAVVHVHDAMLWRHYLDRLPTTDARVAYGTPAMAAEFERLWSDRAFHDSRGDSFREKGLAIMGGHEEGIVSIGRDLAEAAQRILALKATVRRPAKGGSPDADVP